MTDEQARIGKLEDKYHDVDKRQQSFEEFTRLNLQKLEEAIKNTNEQMDRLETNLTNQMNNLLHNIVVAGGVGILAVIVTILLSK